MDFHVNDFIVKKEKYQTRYGFGKMI